MEQPSPPARRYRTALEVDQFVEHVIEQVREGKSVRSVCDQSNISYASVWTRLASPKFAAAYQEAFTLRAMMWADDLPDIADNDTKDKNPDGKGNMAAVARSKLAYDARRWLLGKIFPRQYGDAVALTGADGGPLQISWSDKPVLDITPDE